MFGVPSGFKPLTAAGGKRLTGGVCDHAQHGEWQAVSIRSLGDDMALHVGHKCAG